MRTKSPSLLACLLLGLWFSGSKVAGATVNLPVTADAFILSSAPDHNAGGNTLLNIGTDGQGGVRRGLLRFDLASIPAGATVTSAVLRLTVVRIPFGGPANSNFELNRLLAEWSEGSQAGNSGAPAADGEVTWNSRLHNAGSWSEPGAASDVEPTPSATTFVNTVSGVTYEWKGSGVARDVQEWINDPGLNFGWLLRSDAENSLRTARAFAAREYGSSIGTLEIGFTQRTNRPPTVGINSPTNGTILNTGTITITAVAADTDGNIALVQFFDGAILLESDTSPPYSINVALTNGNHALTAVATDNEGATTTSAVVTVNYSQHPPPVLQIIRSNQNLIIQWAGPFVLEASSALDMLGMTTWTSLPGTSPVTTSVSAVSNRFFRAVLR